MNILISGSLAYDRIMNFPGYFKDHILPDKIHNLNVSFLAQNLKESFGGTAGNIAYNLALLGEKPTILSSVGNDFENYKKWLKQNKIDVSKIQTIKDDTTAFANIITDKADNQIAAFYPGAMNQNYDTNSVPTRKDTIAIIAPGNPKDMVNLARLYYKENIPFIFDPGQQIPVLNKRDLQYCIIRATIFISNDYELELMAQKTKWTKEQIAQKTNILITTYGEKGSVIRECDSTFDINPAKPKKVKDPTGAGDAYRAGLIKGLIEKWPLWKIGDFASTVACYAVENYGTQNHKFNFEEVKRRYKINYKNQL